MPLHDSVDSSDIMQTDMIAPVKHCVITVIRGLSWLYWTPMFLLMIDTMKENVPYMRHACTIL